MALHPAAMVVRGGSVRDVPTLKEKVEEAIEDGYGACVSVFADVDKVDEESGMSLDELCRVSGLPHGKVQLSTPERLIGEGFEPQLDTSNDQGRTHHNVTFTQPVEESELLRFIGCFDEPVENPAAKRKPR